MLKRIFTLLIAVAALFALSGHAEAVPVYYTFTGVTTSGSDGAGAIVAAVLTTSGSAVSYTFLVDRAVDGTLSRYNGATYTFGDTSNRDYFHTALVSAPVLQNQGGGYAPFQTGGHVEEYNVGWERLSTNETYLVGGSVTEPSRVDNNGTWNGSIYLYMGSWTIGTTGFRGYSSASSSSGAWSSLTSSLTLTGISSTNPLTSVPEPGTLLLLGSGLAGLGFVRRRFKQ